MSASITKKNYHSINFLIICLLLIFISSISRQFLYAENIKKSIEKNSDPKSIIKSDAKNDIKTDVKIEEAMTAADLTGISDFSDKPLIIKDAEQLLQRIKESNSELSPEIVQKNQEIIDSVIVDLKKTSELTAKTAEFENIAVSSKELIAKLTIETEKASAELPLPEMDKNDLAFFENLLLKEETESGSLQKKLDDINSELGSSSNRRIEIPKLISQAKTRLESISESALQSTAAGVKDTSEAQKMGVKAKKGLIKAEIVFLEKELSTYDNRLSIIKAKRDLLTKLKDRHGVYLKSLREMVSKKRSLEAEIAAEKARDALRKSAYSHPAVTALAREVALLAEKRTGPTGLSSNITNLVNKIAATEKSIVSLDEDMKGINNKIEIAGLTDAIGLLLRKKKDDIPDVSRLGKSIEKRKKDISEVQLKLLELDDNLKKMVNRDQLLQNIFSKIDAPQIQMDYIKNSLEELLDKKREQLEILVKDFNTYFVRLIDLDTLEKQLQEKAKVHLKFIDERILWIESCQPFSVKDLAHSFSRISKFLPSSDWKMVCKNLYKGVSNQFFNFIQGIIALLIILFLSRKTQNILDNTSEQVLYPASDNSMHTLKAMLASFIPVFFIPGVLYLISFLIKSGTPDNYIFGNAVVHALASSGRWLFVLLLFRSIFRKKGLAESHFKWKPIQIISFIYSRLGILALVGTPVYFIFKISSKLDFPAFEETTGRLFFIFGVFFFSLIMATIFRPGNLLFSDLKKDGKSNYLYKARYLIFFMFVIIPFIVIILAFNGYFYTAQEIFKKVSYTLGAMFFLQFSYSILCRYLFTIQRSFAMARAEEKIKELQAIKESDNQEVNKVQDDIAPKVENDNYEFHNLGKQARKFFKALAILGVIAAFWVIWSDVLPAMRGLDRVELWNTSIKAVRETSGVDGKLIREYVDTQKAITLFDISIALLTVIITIIVGKNLPGLIEFLLLRNLPLDHGAKFAIRTITSYLITTTGGCIAMYTIGISWDKVQWLIAAVSVGIGFGLQEIFANFVSGLIILFERPMRVGDILTVGDVSGIVTKIKIRATTITDWDRKEVIIPNKEFITGRLVNWTLTDSIMRTIFKVGVAYGSDTARVQKILLNVAKQNSKILNDPLPKAIMVGFGDSSLDFELRVFIPNMDNWADFIHAVNYEIDQKFREAGIEIPFPQNDLHVKTCSVPELFK